MFFNGNFKVCFSNLQHVLYFSAHLSGREYPFLEGRGVKMYFSHIYQPECTLPCLIQFWITHSPQDNLYILYISMIFAVLQKYTINEFSMNNIQVYHWGIHNTNSLKRSNATNFKTYIPSLFASYPDFLIVLTWFCVSDSYNWISGVILGTPVSCCMVGNEWIVCRQRELNVTELRVWTRHSARYLHLVVSSFNY